MGREDRLYIEGIRSVSIKKINMKNTRIRFLISFDENVDDIIFNIILFINMIKIYSNIDFKLYSCKHGQICINISNKRK